MSRLQVGFHLAPFEPLDDAEDFVDVNSIKSTGNMLVLEVFLRSCSGYTTLKENNLRSIFCIPYIHRFLGN